MGSIEMVQPLDAETQFVDLHLDFPVSHGPYVREHTGPVVYGWSRYVCRLEYRKSHLFSLTVLCRQKIRDR